MDTTSPDQLSERDRRRLDDLHVRLQREARRFVGYPCTALFDYSPLYRFLAFPANNIGDPYAPSNYHLNTHDFEREVLDEFFALTHAPADASWGYVTNGGTEGNMYGIFLARELLPDGQVYYSEDTHYSVNKILRCLHVRNIMIKSLPDGRIDLDDLQETIRIHRDLPPIIFANVGTTMKGAIDDLEGIRAILRELAIPSAYIHADAAFHGMILPFVDDPQPWDFRAGIDSLSISGHKMIGSPIPCGVAIAKRANVDRIARSVDYIGTLDTTLSGSRNAITPLFLWYALRTVGRAGFSRRIAHCLEVADYAIERLGDLGRNPWRHESSPIVVFDRPPHPRDQQVAVGRPRPDRPLDRHAPHHARARGPGGRAPRRLPAGGGPAMKQISVVSVVRPDVIAEMIEAVAVAGVTIETLDSETTDGTVVAILTVDRYDEALRALTRAGFHAVSEDALLVRLDDRPGTLAELTCRFRDAGVSLRSIRIVRRFEGKSFVAITTARTEAALGLVKDVLVSGESRTRRTTGP